MSNLIVVNSGGKKFTTTKETLQTLPYFESLFTRWHSENLKNSENPENSKKSQKNKKIKIFIDRDPDEFKHILSLLRNPHYQLPAEHHDSLHFYGIDPSYIKAKESLKRQDPEKIWWGYHQFKLYYPKNPDFVNQGILSLVLHENKKINDVKKSYQTYPQEYHLKNGPNTITLPSQCDTYAGLRIVTDEDISKITSIKLNFRKSSIDYNIDALHATSYIFDSNYKTHLKKCGISVLDIHLGEIPITFGRTVLEIHSKSEMNIEIHYSVVFYTQELHNKLFRISKPILGHIMVPKKYDTDINKTNNLFSSVIIIKPDETENLSYILCGGQKISINEIINNMMLSNITPNEKIYFCNCISTIYDIKLFNNNDIQINGDVFYMDSIPFLYYEGDISLCQNSTPSKDIIYLDKFFD